MDEAKARNDDEASRPIEIKEQIQSMAWWKGRVSENVARERHFY